MNGAPLNSTLFPQLNNHNITPTRKPDNTNDKIVIEKSTDLLRLDYATIKNTKISNFSGKHYQEWYKQALKIESSPGGIAAFNIFEHVDYDNDTHSPSMVISKITFELIYPTIFGEEIGILGSIKELGNWNQNNIRKLGWTAGNKWVTTLDNKSNEIKGFEFKFIWIENNKIKRWEGGENAKIEFGGIKDKKGKISKCEYVYDQNKRELRLVCTWK